MQVEPHRGSFRFIDKRVLNPVSHRYVVANRASIAGTVSKSLGNIIIANHKYFSRFYSQIAFQEHDLNAVPEDLL